MLVICNRSALLNNIPVVLGMDRDEEGQGRNVSSLCHSWDTHFIRMAMTISIQFELSFLMKNPLGSLRLWESFSLCSAGLNFPCRAVHVFSSRGKKIKALLMRDVGEKKTAGENTLSKSYQSLFGREDTEVSVCLRWQRKLPFNWMLLKGFIFLLVLSLCLGAWGAYCLPIWKSV